jgi:hypothetical protein
MLLHFFFLRPRFLADGEILVNSGERGSRGDVEFQERVEARVLAIGEGEGKESLRAKSGEATAGRAALAAFLDVRVMPVGSAAATSPGERRNRRARSAPRSPISYIGWL